MKIKTNGHINVINLAIGGATSSYMSNEILMLLNDSNITKLTSNDIILIDHSVNDGMTYSNKVGIIELFTGLSNLIYRLLYISQLNNYPTIILLEQWPFRSGYSTDSNRPYNDNYNDNDNYKGNTHLINKYDPYDYHHIYVNISKQFKIPLYSYRDMIWSKYVEYNQSDYKNYLRFHHNVDFGYQHPPWYIHLYYADFIANILQFELLNCYNNSYNSNNIIINNERTINDMNILLNNTNNNNHNNNNNHHDHCIENIEPFIDISAIHMINKQQIIGNITMKPENSWKFIEESNEKYGWIHTNNNTINNDSNTNNNLIDNKYNSVLKIEFNINNNNNNILKNKNKLFLLKIHYLKTYLNSGSIDLFICNKYIKTIDSLWKDYEMYKYSLTEIYLYEYNYEYYFNNCINNTINNNNYNNLNNNSSNNSNNKPMIEFKTLIISDSSKYQSNKHFKKDLYIKARGNQKFKLIAIKLCQTTK